MSDPGISYRTRDEISNMRKTRDCIEYVKGLLLNNNLATEQELKVNISLRRARAYIIRQNRISIEPLKRKSKPPSSKPERILSLMKMTILKTSTSTTPIVNTFID